MLKIVQKYIFCKNYHQAILEASVSTKVPNVWYAYH